MVPLFPGQIEFAVKERALPKLASLSVRLEAGDAAALQGACAHGQAPAQPRRAAAGSAADRCWALLQRDVWGLPLE